jgi:hypothetical protein
MTEATDNRERSTIRFPYGDLADAIAIANTVRENFGLSCTVEQLAGAMHQSLSGAFRNKVATASTFGLIETSRGGITLSDLGSRAIDPHTESEAAAEAFLTVPLYAAVFEKFRGRQLPSDQGFESEIARLGVSPKVAAKARQALQRSAEQAGFFRHGRDRLVQPATSSMRAVAAATAPPEDAPAAMAPAFQEVQGSRHPLLVGLWQELPDPKSGNFGPAKQQQWLEAATVLLKLLYGGDDPTPAKAPFSAGPSER